MNFEQKEKKPFSVKEFFKSTAFKCIAVLLIIVLVSGILLTFCNALFYVSDQDKLDRVLSNIYGESVETTPFEKEDMVVEFDNGTINSAYQVTDSSDYIINSSGTGGFYGKVTCWVVVEVKDNAVSGIRRVVLEGADNDKEYTSHISEDKYNYFSDSFSEEGFTVNDWKNDSLHGGATPTSTMTAIVNSVNTALEFVRTQVLGEAVGPDPYENFSYTDYIDTKQTTYTIADGVITYDLWTTAYGNPGAGAFHIIITVGADKTITSYSIEYNGSTGGYEAGMSDQIYNPDGEDGLLFIDHNAEEIRAMFVETPTGSEGEFVKDDLVDDTLASGATNPGNSTNAGYSNFLCTYAALFAVSNYDVAVIMDGINNLPYTDYIDINQTTCTVADGVITYDLWTTAYGNPGAGAFHIIITVGADKTITSYSIEYNGSTGGYEAGMSDQIYNPDGEDGLLFIDHNAEEIRAMFVETPTGSEGEFVKDDLVDDTLASGATNPGNSTNAGYSNFLCTYAALYATTSYDAYIAYNDYMQSLLFSEIYGESITAEAVDLSGLTTAVGNGTVNSVYSVAGTTDYIINVTALSNFPAAGAGSVTCWVVVETENGAVSGIKNVVIAGNVNQSYIDAGMIKDEALSHFTDIFDGSDFTIDDWKPSLTGSATYSTTAIVDAVNSAMNFVKANLTGGAGE